MILLILSLILTAICIVIVVSKEVDKGGKYKFKTLHMVALLPMVLIVFNLFTIVTANEVGIVYSPFTGVKEEVLTEGFHKKGFFDKVYDLSTEIQTKQMEGLSGQTKDSQFLTMIIDVKYKVSAENGYKVFKNFRKLKNVDKDLISPATQRAIEAVTTRYNVMEILGAKRNEAYREVEIELTKRLSEAGLDFSSITFVDTDAGEMIENAIREEAVAKKAVETALQEQKRNKIENEKVLDTAEAKERQAVIDKRTKLINANALSEANEILENSLTENVLKKMELDARMKHGWITVLGADSVIVSPNN